MKSNIYLLIFSLFTTINSIAQNFTGMQSSFGFEYLSGSLPEISTYYGKDSYQLTNYLTWHLIDYDNEKGITRDFDCSASLYLLTDLLLSRKTALKFQGYNKVSYTNQGLKLVQNRTLLGYSKTRDVSDKFGQGYQFGADIFGVGDIGLYKFGLDSNLTNFVHPGPYVRRINFYLGKNFRYRIFYKNNLTINMGTTLEVSASLGTVGAHISPDLRFQYNMGNFFLKMKVAYDVDYYYNYRYKSAPNLPKNGSMPSNLRIAFELGLPVRER